MSRFFIFLVVTGFVFLILCEMLECFPLFANYISFSHGISQQIAREQIFEIDMLELQTSNNQVVRSNAYSSILATLPLFEQEQATLLNISRSDDAQFVQESLPSYHYMDSALRLTINQWPKFDVIQATIILQRGPQYRLALEELNVLIIAHSEESTNVQFLIKTFLLLGLCIILIAKFLIYRKQFKQFKEKMKSQ